MGLVTIPAMKKALLFLFVIGSVFFYTNSPLMANEVKVQNDEYIIGLGVFPNSLDPHLERSRANFTLIYHIYDTLFIIDDDGKYYSNILDSYKSIDDLVWEFKLKDNIVFHNGVAMTSKDVIYSFERIAKHKNSKLKRFVNRMAGYSSIDKLTFRIKTSEPHPTLMRDLMRLAIVQYRNDYVFGESFFKEKGNVGSGPYILEEYIQNKEASLRINLNYHGEIPFLKKIKLIKIPKGEAGDYIANNKAHLVERIGHTQEDLLSKHGNIDQVKMLSHRVRYLNPDIYRKKGSPYIKAIDGSDLSENPLRNVKVRQAISYAINREFLTHKLMGGAALSAGQLLVPGAVGHTPVLRPDKYSVQAARRLLAEAGYPNGFRVNIHAIQEVEFHEKLIDALADMLKEIDIVVEPVIGPRKVIRKITANSNHSLALDSVSTRGDLKGMVNVLLHTQTELSGRFNEGRYSNPQVDKLIGIGNVDFNEIRRTQSYIQAIEIAMREKAVIPLFFDKYIWAIRNDMGVKYWPRRMAYTLAQDLKKED